VTDSIAQIRAIPVAAVEIICGSTLILGFWTRIATILFIDLSGIE